MNFPTTHHLNHTARATAVVGQADVLIGLELTDFWNTVNAYIDNGENLREPRIKSGTTLISIGAGDFYLKSNYQDFQRFQPVDVSIAGDAEATLPALIEAVRAALPAERKDALAKRGEALRRAWSENRARQLAAAAYGWDASPISTARLCAELWAQIKTEDWSLVSRDTFQSSWPHRLWAMEKHYHYLGGSGGYGEGYNAPAAVGAALANRALGRFSVNIQADGDLMYAPGVLWTAVHHKIPLLSVMHNNRAYHQEVMHVQRMANRHQRGIENAGVGTTITDPNIDFAALARSMGLHGEGPVTNPNDLGPA